MGAKYAAKLLGVWEAELLFAGFEAAMGRSRAVSLPEATILDNFDSFGGFFDVV